MNLPRCQHCRLTGFVPAGSQFSNNPTVVAADVTRRISGTSGTRRSASSPRRLLLERPARRSQGQRAFTLIETIGVLSVIAILASLITPTIMDTVDRARCTEAIASYNQVRSGAMSYAAKYGYLGGPDGRPVDISTATDIAANWDAKVLLPLEYIDRPFRARISSEVGVQLRLSAPASTAPNGTNSAYNLRGGAADPNGAAGVKYVLDVKLGTVPLADARYINQAIDGEEATLGETATGTDLNGRVKYQFPAGENAGEVRIYITHL